MSKNKTKTISLKGINKKLFIINAILLVSFFVSQILVTSSIGTKSSEIEEIRKEKDRLRLENEIIGSDIDKAKSVDSLESVIEKYNLQEKNIISLEEGSSDNIASNRLE